MIQLLCISICFVPYRSMSDILTRCDKQCSAEPGDGVRMASAQCVTREYLRRRQAQIRESMSLELQGKIQRR